MEINRPNIDTDDWIHIDFGKSYNYKYPAPLWDSSWTADKESESLRIVFFMPHNSHHDFVFVAEMHKTFLQIFAFLQKLQIW